MVGHEQREAAPRRINRRMLVVRNWRPQSSSFWLDGRQLGSYSLTFRICPPGQRLSAPLVPLERFAIRLKKRRIANQAIRIEPIAPFPQSADWAVWCRNLRFPTDFIRCSRFRTYLTPTILASFLRCKFGNDGH